MGSVVQSRTKSKRRKAAPRATASGPVGLCSTCINRPECVYRESRGFDAVFCELFDDVGQSNGDHAPAVKSVPVKTGEGGTDAMGKLKGLCLNCKHRDTCVLPHPDGGVWHCEEYE
jgi:hypothetical protein